MWSLTSSKWSGLGAQGERRTGGLGLRANTAGPSLHKDRTPRATLRSAVCCAVLCQVASVVSDSLRSHGL